MNLVEDHYVAGDPVGALAKMLCAAEVGMAYGADDKVILTLVRMMGMDNLSEPKKAKEFMIRISEAVLASETHLDWRALDHINRETVMTVTGYQDHMSEVVRATMDNLRDTFESKDKDSQRNMVLVLKTTEREIIRLLRRNVNEEGLHSIMWHMEDTAKKYPEFGGLIGKFSLTLAMLQMVFSLGYIDIEEMGDFSERFSKAVSMEVDILWSQDDQSDGKNIGALGPGKRN